MIDVFSKRKLPYQIFHLWPSSSLAISITCVRHLRKIPSQYQVVIGLIKKKKNTAFSPFGSWIFPLLPHVAHLSIMEKDIYYIIHVWVFLPIPWQKVLLARYLPHTSCSHSWLFKVNTNSGSPNILFWAYQIVLVVKNLPAKAGDARDAGSCISWVGMIPWRRKWQPAPVFLAGKSHRQRSLVGYSPWGHRELDTTEQISTILYFIQNLFDFSLISHLLTPD